MRHFPNIARLAKRLGVSTFIFASAHDGNDVIENQLLGCSAPNAGRFLPCLALKRCEVSPVSQQFSWGRWAGNGGQHFVSIFRPSSFQSRSDFGAGFRRMFIAFGWATLSFVGVSYESFAYSGESLIVVSFPPKGIVSAHHGFADAFPVFTSHTLMFSEQIVSAPIVKRSANAAGNHSACFLSGHGNSDNGVKSVDTPLYALGRMRAIPSQARQEWREGVTTRAWSPERTVKPHERTTRKGRDSLSLSGMAGNADKEPRDNKTDEVLNITPNSPISAAQFSLKQYAGAVSISGLEILQNSGEEALIDLLEGRQKIAEAQLMNRMDYDMYQDGTGNSSKNITGLAAVIPDDPTTGTYGNISRNSYNFWRSPPMGTKLRSLCGR